MPFYGFGPYPSPQTAAFLGANGFNRLGTSGFGAGFRLSSVGDALRGPARINSTSGFGGGIALSSFGAGLGGLNGFNNINTFGQNGLSDVAGISLSTLRSQGLGTLSTTAGDGTALTYGNQTFALAPSTSPSNTTL